MRSEENIRKKIKDLEKHGVQIRAEAHKTVLRANEFYQKKVS